MPAFRLVIIFVFLFLSFQSYSHSGITSAEGCHSNESVSGYHCHNQNAKRNRYPYTISQKIIRRPKFEKKGKIQTRQIASMNSKSKTDKSRPSLKYNSQVKRLAGIKNKSLPQSEKNGFSKDFQPEKGNKTRGLASIKDRSKKMRASSLPSQLSLKRAVSYELFEEKVDDTPLKTQIIQHLIVQGIPSKDHLKTELMQRYRVLKTRQGFKHRPSPTGIYIYIYETKKHKGSGRWIALLGWNAADAVQTKDPSVQFNESLLSQLSNTGKDNKSALVQGQKFAGSAQNEAQRKSKEKIQTPVKALKGVSQIRKKMTLNNAKAVQFKGKTNISKTQYDRKKPSKVSKKRFSKKARMVSRPSKKAPRFQSKKRPPSKIKRAGASLSKPLVQARKAVSRVQKNAQQKRKAMDFENKPSKTKPHVSK